jgi:hypothetical protein
MTKERSDHMTTQDDKDLESFTKGNQRKIDKDNIKWQTNGEVSDNTQLTKGEIPF